MGELKEEFDFSYNPYKKAYERIQESDTSSILSSKKLTENRDIIRDKMLEWFEGTEEFEKCKIIIDFFDKVEREIKIMEIVKNISKDPKK